MEIDFSGLDIFFFNPLFSKGCVCVRVCALSVYYLKEVERNLFEDTDDPRKGPLGAVGEQHHLQTARHQGTVEDILLQQNLTTQTHL